MNFNKIKHILFTLDYMSLAKEDCHILAYIIFILCFIPLLVLTILFYLNSESGYAFCLIFSVLLLVIGLVFPIFFSKELGIKFNYETTNSYQCNILTFFSILPGTILIIIISGIILSKMFLSLSISLALILPTVGSFIRINSNSRFNSSIEYNLIYYNLFSIIIGLYGYSIVFNHLFDNYYFATIGFILTLFFQMILIFPDKINNIDKINLNSKKYGLIYLFIHFITYLAIITLLQLLFLDFYSLIQFNVNFKGVIIWIGIIIFLWFIYKKK